MRSTVETQTSTRSSLNHVCNRCTPPLDEVGDNKVEICYAPFALRLELSSTSETTSSEKELLEKKRPTVPAEPKQHKRAHIYMLRRAHLHEDIASKAVYLGEIEEAVKRIQSRLGKNILTESEFSDAFLNQVVIPFLRSKIGDLPAYAKLNRTITKGRYDARIGDLVIEFEPPLKGIEIGKKQAKQYIREFRNKGEVVNCFVTDGDAAVFVDKDQKEGQPRKLLDSTLELQERLLTSAGTPVEPDDLLAILGLSSDIGRSHVRILYDTFRKFKDHPFIDECLALWKSVYGAAANLTPEAVTETKASAKILGIDLDQKDDVEQFLFVVETYLSLLMKLFVVAIARERRIVVAPSLGELLSQPVRDFKMLADKIPFLKSAFEHDAFTWFTDPAESDKYTELEIGRVIANIAKVLDQIKLSTVKVDLLRRLYQRFFEPSIRKALGEFYTNERIVEEVLTAVEYRGRDILTRTLLDPACGSGTFLIVAIRNYIDEGRKYQLSNSQLLERVVTQIKGIDIHPFAVAMARVNYLLAISDLIDPKVRETLHALDIPIYWTDSLATFTEEIEPTGLPVVRVDVAPFSSEIVEEKQGRPPLVLPPSQSVAWDALFDVVRKAIEESWDDERYLREFPDVAREEYEATLLRLLNLFRKRKENKRNGRWLPTLKNVTEVDQLRGNCDYVVGNPPWVRIHNVDPHLKKKIEERFKFYGKDASWDPNLARLNIIFKESVDYSVAFVESGLNFLKEGGRLGFVITSNVVRSLYGGEMRKKIVAETKILSLIDYALSRVKLFEEAQNAPLVMSIERKPPSQDHAVKIEMENRRGKKGTWELMQKELPLYEDQFRSPWLIAPQEIVTIVRKMQKTGPKLGNAVDVKVGIYTNANPTFFVKNIGPTDEPDVALVETTGKVKARMEKEILRPLLRGRNVSSWRYEVVDHILWTHDDRGQFLATLPPLAKRYFKSQESKLKDRQRYTIISPISKGAPFWIIGDADKISINHKVAWQRVEKIITAVYISSKFKGERIVLDNSVSFMTVANENAGYALSGVLNSSPVRVYVATYVLRTGAEYCNYLGWYMGVIPVPDFVLNGQPNELVELSRKLHQAGEESKERIHELDDVVAGIYGLTAKELAAMQDFLQFFAEG